MVKRKKNKIAVVAVFDVDNNNNKNACNLLKNMSVSFNDGDNSTTGKSFVGFGWGRGSRRLGLDKRWKLKKKNYKSNR